MLQKYHAWAWALGIVLIWADLVLPIPQAAVIAALGILYGTLLGGLLGSLGLITSGLLGYMVMRTSARRFVQRFVGPRSLYKMEGLFDRGGAWAIVLTRSSVPEAMVFLAGVAGMPMRKFIAALTIGSVPTAFAFSAIGAGWARGHDFQRGPHRASRRVRVNGGRSAPIASSWIRRHCAACATICWVIGDKAFNGMARPCSAA